MDCLSDLGHPPHTNDPRHIPIHLQDHLHLAHWVILTERFCESPEGETIVKNCRTLHVTLTNETIAGCVFMLREVAELDLSGRTLDQIVALALEGFINTNYRSGNIPEGERDRAEETLRTFEPFGGNDRMVTTFHRDAFEDVEREETAQPEPPTIQDAIRQAANRGVEMDIEENPSPTPGPTKAQKERALLLDMDRLPLDMLKAQRLDQPDEMLEKALASDDRNFQLAVEITYTRIKPELWGTDSVIGMITRMRDTLEEGEQK